MNFAEYGAYCWILQSADAATGIWWGSAKALSSQVSISERLARRLLEGLGRKNYIKRFSTGRRKGNYAVIIHHFICSRGAQRGKSLNALETTDWRRPIYDKGPTGGAQVGAELSADWGAEMSSVLEVEVKKERQETEEEHFVLPDWIDPGAWKGFEEMRRKTGHKLTGKARSLGVKALEILRDKGFDPKAVLEQSTFNSWRGLFPVRREESNAAGASESLATRRSREGSEAAESAIRNLRDRSDTGKVSRLPGGLAGINARTG